MRASVITLGCKVNEYETQSILSQLSAAGYDIDEGLVPADLYVVNTCAVTNTGEKKSKQVLSKIEKINPNAQIIVCGCAVQSNPNKFLSNKNVVALTGNFGKENIVDIIQNKNMQPLNQNGVDYVSMARPTQTKTRQYIKIQDGCDYFCSYCIIPYLRGRSRSRDLDDIIDEIKHTKANEIVLTGINMSDYKIDGKLALKTLIKKVDELGKRFRLSSIECLVIDDEMIEILKNCKNFCHHFHLSLQSACNSTLKRMNRHYTIEQFKEIVKKLKSSFDDVCISTDIIVGFKGETEEEFKNTIENLKEIEFSFMHIFPYSERSNTVAAKMTGDVPKEVTKTRENELQKLNKDFKTKFYQENKGKIREVLVELVDENFSLGYTDNYIYTYVSGKHKVGDIIKVKLNDLYLDGMKAERV